MWSDPAYFLGHDHHTASPITAFVTSVTRALIQLPWSLLLSFFRNIEHDVMGFFTARRTEEVEHTPNHDPSVVRIIRSRFVRPSIIHPRMLHA